MEKSSMRSSAFKPLVVVLLLGAAVALVAARTRPARSASATKATPQTTPSRARDPGFIQPARAL